MTALTHAFPVRRHRKVRGLAFPRVSVPGSVRKLAEIPLTTAGLGLIVSGIAAVCVPAALIIGGFALIGLEYVIADN